ncbi:MAG: transcriptional regulator [Alteromonadaceae bacterium]|nr:transcriptional regulator [Alteromonadaceae bacterium]
MRTEQFFRCLADQKRINTILLIWHSQEVSLFQLACVLEQSENSVARNMALLLKNNIVIERRQELDRLYRINPELPRWAYKVLKHTYIGNKHILEGQLLPLEDGTENSATHL